MTPDYQAEMERRQREEQKYQQTRDPFEYGRQVAQRRYSEIMSGIDARQQATAQSYSDMYQAARQQAVKSRAAGGPTLSGGMAAQYSDLLSVAENQQLGQIGRARTQAMSDLDLQRQSAISNAELEGQQATQIQLQNQQLQVDLIAQKNQILANEDLTNEQKAEQLSVLGYRDQAEELRATPDSETESPGWLAFAGAGSTALFATAKAIGAKKALAATAGVLAKAGPVGWGILAVGAAILSVDKLLEWVAPDQDYGAGKGEGFVNLGPLFGI